MTLPDNVRKVADVHGNAQSYTLRRLARHRPDLLEAFERGEITANAAAAAARTQAKKLLESVAPVAGHGVNQHSAGRDNVTSTDDEERGNAATYALRRLAG